MADASRVGELFVEFSTRGLDAVKAAADALRAQMTGAAESVTAQATATAERFTAGISRVAAGRPLEAPTVAVNQFVEGMKKATAEATLLDERLRSMGYAGEGVQRMVAGAAGSLGKLSAEMRKSMEGLKADLSRPAAAPGGALAGALAGAGGPAAELRRQLESLGGARVLGGVERQLAGLGEAGKQASIEIGKMAVPVTISGQLAEVGKRMALLTPVADQVKAAVARAFAAGPEQAKAMVEQAKRLSGELGNLVEAEYKRQRAQRDVQRGMEAVRDVQQGVMGSIGGLTMRLYGFVQAGFSASASGQVFGYQMQELQRQIASLFVPQIRAVLDYMGQLVRWFQTLTGEQQASMRRWALLAGSIMAAVMILPKLIAGFQALALVIRGAGVAMTLLSAHPLVLIAMLVAALIVMTMDWRAILGDLDSGLTKVGNVGRNVFGELFKILVKITAELGKQIGYLNDWINRKLALPEGTFRVQELGSQAQVLRLATAPREHEVLRQDWERLMAEQSRQGSFVRWLSRHGIGEGGNINPVADIWRMLGASEAKPRGEELPPLRGFEAVDQAYRRIAEASIKATGAYGFRSPQQESAEYLRQIYETIQRVEAPLTNVTSPFVR
jgi:hypothetical protein